jgi:hypothetical protein
VGLFCSLFGIASGGVRWCSAVETQGQGRAMVSGLQAARGLVLVLALPACSNVDLHQGGRETRVLAGGVATTLPPDTLPTVAPLYAQYAYLSALTYEDHLYGLVFRQQEGRPKRRLPDVEHCSGGRDCDALERRLKQVRAIWGGEPLIAKINECSADAIRGARRDFDRDGKSSACNAPHSSNTRVIDGLGIQIWARRDGACGEMVIAFRGTDFEQEEDWISNLRWVTRVLPLHDQYEQVQEHINKLIDDGIQKMGCKPRRITAVGHSLGGGLAQHAAYAQRAPRITHVFGFDPSFVTGYFDRHIDPARRAIVEQKLKIDRVYEHGEILAYPRFVLRHIYPLSACGPQIRSIRFNFLDGDVRSQHSIVRLTQALLVNSPAAVPRKVLDDRGIIPSSHKADPLTGACLVPPQAS